MILEPGYRCGGGVCTVWSLIALRTLSGSVAVGILHLVLPSTVITFENIHSHK